MKNAIFKTRFWLFSVFTSVFSFHDEVRGYMFATLAFGLWDQRIEYYFFFLRTAPARVDALQQSLSGKRQVGSEKLRKTIFTWNKPSLDKSPPEKKGEKRQEKG